MLISLFGTVDAATINQMATRGHQFLVSDSPSDTTTLANLKEAKVKFAVAPAAWRNVDHPRSQEDTRVNSNTGEIESYNRNGGFVRDAQMVEQADAVVVGEGINPSRLAVIDQEAAEHNKPLRQAAPTRPVLSREEAEAELEACFATEPPKPRKRGKKAEAEAEAETFPF